MTDAQHEQATARIRALLATRPDLKPALETLYATAWPATLALVAALPTHGCGSNMRAAATVPR